MYKYLIKIRELFSDNFCIKLLGYYKNKNQIFMNKIFNYIPFKITKNILKFRNYNYYYKKDNIIYFNSVEKITILPLYLSFKIDNLEIRDILKKYQNNFPLWLILHNENLQEPEHINIQFITKNITLDYQKVKDKKLYEILT